MNGLCWASMALCAAVLAQGETPNRDLVSVQDGVQRGLLYLEDRGVAWKTEHGCASCHHVPMMVWTMNEAKARGYSINDTVLDETTRWLEDESDPAGLLPAKPNTIRAIAASYALGAVTIPLRGNDALGESKGTHYIRYLLNSQTEDGAWPPLEGRPPVIATQRETTLLAGAILAGVRAEPDSPETRAIAASVSKVKAWFERQGPFESFQERNYWLLLLVQTDGDPDEIAALVKTIVAEQRPDGGWAQTLDMESDAYATGQALYVLAEASDTIPRDVFTRGATYLTTSQAGDGSWSMTSRPMGPDGNRAKNLEPITYAGSAWAILGLLHSSSP